MTPTISIPGNPPGSGSVSSKWFGAGWTDRVLAIFTSVEAGEGIGALLLAGNVFLLLTAYYILKTVREALILAQGGAEVKAYASAGQAALLLAAVPAYGWLASRLTRFRLVAAVMLFFLANLPIFYALNSSGVSIGIAFYLWLGIFNLMALAQFWAFASDLYTEEQGKRLFPVLGIGSSLGALAGARIAAIFFADLGVGRLLVLAGTLMGGSLLLTWLVNRRACAACAQQRSNNSSALGSRGGFEIVSADRYLRLIALMVVLLNVVNTGGEYVLSKLVVAEAAQAAAGAADPAAVKQAFIGQFYGNYFAWVGFGGLILQAFLVSRLFRWIGVRGALFLLPTIAFGGYALLAALPALSIALTTKVFENSTDYSVENTARHALFLPVNREAKYKAKTAIDTFFYRTGDMTQAGVVWLGTSLAFTTRHFALTNVCFIVAWLGVTFMLSKNQPEPAPAPALAASGD
jgi:ATP:ADP antiporter, AAA family